MNQLVGGEHLYTSYFHVFEATLRLQCWHIASVRRRFGVDILTLIRRCADVVCLLANSITYFMKLIEISLLKFYVYVLSMSVL